MLNLTMNAIGSSLRAASSLKVKIRALYSDRRSPTNFRPPAQYRAVRQVPLRSEPCRLQPRAASKAAVVQQAAVFQATGVPLVDKLMQMGSLEAAAQHSATLVGAALAGVVVGGLLLRLIDDRLGSRLDQAKGIFNLPAAALASTLQPAQVLLPFYGLAYGSTVVAAWAQVAATKKKAEVVQLFFGRGEELLAAAKWLAQLLQDTTELVLIIFTTWAAINFKDRAFRWAARLLSRDGDAEGGVVHLLSPLSGIISFAILLAAGTTALSAYGVNIGPLVASVGGISVAVGLATQSIAANFVSALSLYSGRPFVVGDRVQLLSRGSNVVEGVVVLIEPLRTVIRDDNGNPIYFSNTEVTSCAVRNFSQGAARKAGKTA